MQTTSCRHCGPVWQQGKLGATGEDLRRLGLLPEQNHLKSKLWFVASTFDLELMLTIVFPFVLHKNSFIPLFTNLQVFACPQYGRAPTMLLTEDTKHILWDPTSLY